MDESIVFVVDTPSTLRRLAPHLSRSWTCRVYAITTLHFGLFEFRYPRGLHLADFPFVGEPRWKARKLDGSAVFEVIDGTPLRSEEEFAIVLRGARAVWFADSPDASGVVAFDVLLSEGLGAPNADITRPALFLRSLDPRAIGNALACPGSTGDGWFAELRNAGLAKRFFEFNFNVNSLSLLGQALRQVGCVDREHQVSKFSLQLLYFLRHSQPLSDAHLFDVLAEWSGTGRYARSPMGSAASRPAMLKALRGAGLVREGGSIELTSSGQRFLDLLHPDCCDLDLPARLDRWARDWPRSKPAIERYIRTFFGKQRRFASCAE